MVLFFSMLFNVQGFANLACPEGLARHLRFSANVVTEARLPEGPRRARAAGRVEDWRVGLGRCLCSLLTRPFVCECHNISSLPRFQPPPPQTGHADFPHPAFGQGFMRSPTKNYASALLTGPIPTSVRDRYQGSVISPVPAFCAWRITTGGADDGRDYPLPDRPC